MSGGKKEKKYSYIKKPYARSGFYCFFLSVLAVLLFSAAMGFSLHAGGSGGMNAGALGFSSMVMALMSLWFMWLSFREPERNYIFSKTGGVLSGILVLIWIGILIVGFGA
ncbi:MAG: hypothetical protein Q4C63_02695 [Eubacteriales bacterium]|nr:hypothetical protein [Eubacteriales bacterium]